MRESVSGSCDLQSKYLFCFITNAIAWLKGLKLKERCKWITFDIKRVIYKSTYFSAGNSLCETRMNMKMNMRRSKIVFKKLKLEGDIDWHKYLYFCEIKNVGT